MLEFWYGGNSPVGPGKPNAADSGSSASSSEPTKESETTITPGPIASALCVVLRNGTSSSHPTKEALPQLRRLARNP